MVAQCDQCSFTTRYNYNLERHKLWNHSDVKPFVCTFTGCSYRAKSNGNLNKHRRIHETDIKLRRPYPCTFENCEYRGSHKHALTRHVAVRHTHRRTKDRQCPLCPSKFYWASQLTEHIQYHTQETRLSCPDCDFKTHIKRKLNQHLKKMHESSKAFNCSSPGCNYRTFRANDLTAHRLRKHDPHPVVQPLSPCKYPGCVYRAGSALQLKVHIGTVHDPARKKDVTCPLCSKHFYNDKGLKDHVKRVHSHETIRYCENCHFSTRYTSVLKTHRRRVHGDRVEKQFKCEQCDYRAFEKKRITRHHRIVHSAEWKIKCSYPGCSFKTYLTAFYKEHLLSHENDPSRKYPFSCDVPACDFRSRLQLQMKRHMELHETSKRVFKCKRCLDRCYPNKKSLNYHSYVTHKKSYKCSMCDYFVYQHCALARHYNKYHLPSFISVRKTYECSKCEFESKNSSGVHLHMRRMHRELLSSEKIDPYESGCITRSDFQCSLCSYKPTDYHDAAKHSVVHRIASIRLQRVHFVKI